MLDVFNSRSYREFIKSAIKANNTTRGYQARLADAAGCQKTYLSQVLHSNIHLTMDHAAGLCRFWQFSEEQTSYFLDLVQIERSSSPHLTSFLKARLETIRRSAADLSTRYKTEAPIDDASIMRYYSAWYWGAIHVLLSIPNQWSDSKIAAHLRLPLQQVSETLVGLAAMHLVEKKPDGWVTTKNSLHLPRGSPLTALNHFNWRNLALSRLLESPNEGLHYTAIQALSVEDAKRMQERIMACIDETRAIVAPSPEEKMVAFTCDFFSV